MPQISEQKRVLRKVIKELRQEGVLSADTYMEAINAGISRGELIARSNAIL